MSTATPTPAAAAAAAAKKPAAKAPDVFYVLDTTAIAGLDGGKRVHQQIIDGVVRDFTFEAGKPLPLPRAIALKFLKHESFKLTDAQGNLRHFKRPPKQPHELQAGEQLVLADDETVARYDELSTQALQHRALEMAGGEKFAGESPKRDAMIEFIVTTKLAFAARNKSKQADVGKDEFIPTAEQDDEIDLEDAA